MDDILTDERKLDDFLMNEKKKKYKQAIFDKQETILREK